MCGIIAVVRRANDTTPISAESVEGPLGVVCQLLEGIEGASTLWGSVSEAAEQLQIVDTALRGVSGVLALYGDSSLTARVSQKIAQCVAVVSAIESDLDAGRVAMSTGDLEVFNSAFVRLKDVVWAIERDRLRVPEGIAALGGKDVGAGTVASLFSVHQALSALDRLEVRGRDSAGIEIVVADHGLDIAESTLAERNDAGFAAESVRATEGSLVFVYKAAFEIGELGDNTAELRRQIRSDELLARALAAPGAWAMVLGHTRWASVGIISEHNAHPQGSEEAGRSTSQFVTAVLNGDVDNHTDLVSSVDLVIPDGITTDAKVIPALMARHLEQGATTATAFRETVAALEGSVAISAHSMADPSRLMLALRGSGQALYVGLADDAFIVASEPYGVVEETSHYLRLDGETPSNPDNESASRGQIFELRAERAGEMEGLTRWSYDGSEMPLSDDEVVTAEITTRDIDRGDFPHFLLKEISDVPGSFRKTLRGKLVDAADGSLAVHVGTDTMPADLADRITAGDICRVLVIGQGTAAVAGQSLALLLSELVADTTVAVEAVPATELSGFRLRVDMSDTLIVAISQSGTTTDTNRTVDLVRSRGAAVISVVNRRNSDLCDKSDGVLYTSDGRDVEMSVASTKAFYSQIAAGMVLAHVIADRIEGARHSAHPESQELLSALRDLPDRLVETLSRRETFAAAAQRFCPSRRYWAIVGNGPNQIAARELRIKLSELCYKSIVRDATEDKKHIDLSSEPLILVCAAGLVGSTAGDVGKEVAIFRAHKAAPIVIATDGDSAFSSALAVLSVPSTHPRLAFVLSAMVGHLFGYEAALAIDAQADPLRSIRGSIEAAGRSMTVNLSSGSPDLLTTLATRFAAPAESFLTGLRAGEYDGHLEAGTAVRVSTLLRYALGISGLDTYQMEFGKIGTPGVVLDDLTAALSSGIDELTRPVDAIKHQAKTVTVGISRSDESLLLVPLVVATLGAGAPRDRLAYSTLRALSDLDPAVDEVVGYTRYRVEDCTADGGTAVVIDRGGIALGLESRTDRDGCLRGTKHLVARELELMVARGRKDGRMVLIIPEIKDRQTTGLTLLHLRLVDRLPTATIRGVLQGYRRRYQALRDAVTETEDHFRDELLAEQDIAELLCMPILDLAERWRS